jgi:outer membrane beta-barrel protein
MKFATLIALTLLACQASWAQGKKSSKAPANSAESKATSDKVDISDLEHKYWAPKDTDFSVVQNRTYTKAKKVVLSLQYGPTINDNWSEGYDLGVSANYFLSERYGVQATYVTSDLKNKSSLQSLINFGGGVKPDFGRMKSYYGIGFNWVPFYAKMSLLGHRILYFDMAFTPTVGMTQYDQQTVNGPQHKSAFTYGIDITQYYFLYKWFAIRADLKNQWYSEEIVKYQQGSSTTPTGAKLRTESNHTSIFLIGFSFFF